MSEYIDPLAISLAQARRIFADEASAVAFADACAYDDDLQVGMPLGMVGTR